MLDRYNAETPPSSSYHESSQRSAAFLNPSKDSTNDDRYIAELPPAVPLPRAKVAAFQHHPTSAMFHTYNHQSEYIMESYQPAINKYNDDFRYNVPLHERFHQ